MIDISRALLIMSSYVARYTLLITTGSSLAESNSSQNNLECRRCYEMPLSSVSTQARSVTPTFRKTCGACPNEVERRTRKLSSAVALVFKDRWI
jgi:hypothetical protein